MSRPDRGRFTDDAGATRIPEPGPLPEPADCPPEVASSADSIAAVQPRPVRPPRRRAVLRVGSEQLAALLRLPADVTIATFELDWLRDSVAFVLEGDRFEPVDECCEPLALVAELAVDVAEDGAVTQRVTWPGLEGVEIIVRHEPAEEVSAVGD